MQISVAVLAFTNPFAGKKDGGKTDIYNRIKSLEGIGNKIDIYTLTKKNEIVSDFKNIAFRNINVYEDIPQNKLSYLFNSLPISVNNKYSNKLANKLSNNSYDLCIFEGEHMYKYMQLNKINSKVNFIRMHDIESIYRKELHKSSTNKITSLLQYNDSIKYSKLERKLVDKFNKFLFISKAEKEIFDDIYKENRENFVWMPPVVWDYKKDINYRGANLKKILFFGDLSVPHNKEGILWFVNEVYPKIREKVKDVTVDIIGNISDAFKEKISGNQINVIGYVKDLNKYIDDSTLIICPILHGAGVKVKLVEALAKGKIVIATNKAIEGTDFQHDKHLLVSDINDEFAMYCKNVLVEPEKYYQLPIAAIKKVREKYTIENQTKSIRDLYNDCI